MSHFAKPERPFGPSGIHCPFLKGSHLIGSAAFVSLYQPPPSAAEGSIFQRSWWCRNSEEPKDIKRIILSLDSAFKTGAQNDFTACTVWGITSSFYLPHLHRQRLELPGIKSTPLCGRLTYVEL